MKRDMELVRQILISVDEADDLVDIERFVDERYSMAVVAYHVRLMEAHGLIDAEILYADNRAYHGVISGLTWDGADFLDAIKDDGIWKKTKAAIKRVSTSVTLQTIRETAVMVAEQAIKASLGM